MILLTYAENELHRQIASVPEHFFPCIWSFTKSWFLSNQKCIKFTHSLTFNRTFLLLKFLSYNLFFEVCCNIVFIFFVKDRNFAMEITQLKRNENDESVTIILINIIKSEVRTERGFSPKRCTDWLLKINFMLFNNQATLKTVMPIYVFSINEHEPWVEDWKKILY